MARWWNGRHSRLKICRTYVRASSTLVFHTSNRGSIPRASTKLGKYDMLDYIEAMVAVTVLMGLAVWFYLEKR